MKASVLLGDTSFSAFTSSEDFSETLMFDGASLLRGTFGTLSTLDEGERLGSMVVFVICGEN